MVTITDKAKNKIDHLIQDSGLDASYFLRVSVQGGGCSGLSYNLDFDNEIKKGDQFFEDKGIRLALDMKSFLYLAGTELDFSDVLTAKSSTSKTLMQPAPVAAARVSRFRIF